MSRRPEDSIFYREHEAVKAYLNELQRYRETGLMPEEIATAFQGKKAIFNLFFGVDQKRIAHIQEEACDCEFIRLLSEIPAADVATVVPELRKAVKVLHEEYERAKNSPFVRDPLAYALYQVWKAADRGEIGR